MANKRFTTIKNDFAITFDNFCHIEEIEGGDAGNQIQGGGYSFTTLKEVKDNVAGDMYVIDLIAVVSEL